MPPLLRIIGLILVLATNTVCTRSCYTPAGEDRNAQFNDTSGPVYEPCSNKDGLSTFANVYDGVFLVDISHSPDTESMCCATGPGRGAVRDSCRSDGLCDNAERSAVWRESCTDPTWEDPACLKLFLNGTGYHNGTKLQDGARPLSDVKLTLCSDQSYCYDINNDACCEQGLGVFLNARGEQTNERPEAVTPTTTSLTATTLSSTSTPSPSSKAIDVGLSTGARAGIGVGVAVIVVLIAAVTSFYIIKRGHRSRASNAHYSTSSSGQRILPEMEDDSRTAKRLEIHGRQLTELP